MKKIIPFIVIIVGVVLFTIGNTIQMYSTINIIEKRLAEKEQSVDTVEVKQDTMSFDEEMVVVDSLLRVLPMEVPDAEMIPNFEVRDNNSYGQTLIRYNNGVPKIVVFWYESRETKTVRRSRHIYFLRDDGRRLAEMRSLQTRRFWICTPDAVDELNVKLGFLLSNPNVCRNINKSN